MKNKTKKRILCILIIFSIIICSSCHGIEFENQKIAKAEEFPIGEVMIFVAEEKNKYENRFGSDVWNLKNGNGDIFFKDYIVSVSKNFIEQMMILKLVAVDLGIVIGNADLEKIKEASKEYYDSLTFADLDYISCTEEEVFDAFRDYHLTRLVVDNLSKKASTELSISEAKVIKVQYIVFEDREKAEETIESLKAKGANFAYFAKTRSLDTDIEMIIKRGDELSTRFPELFYLSAGQTSEVLQFKNRFYLFKCIDDYLEKETEERRLEVLRSMKNAEFNENYQKYKNEYKIKSNSQYWRTIDLQQGENCKVNNFEDIYYKYFPKLIK